MYFDEYEINTLVNLKTLGHNLIGSTFPFLVAHKIMVLLKINAMLICNNLKLETIQMSINRGMDRQMYIHAGILLSNKKE